MAFHTLKQLNDKTAEYIQLAINSGYRICPTEQHTDNGKFYVRLYNNKHNTVFILTTEVTNDSFIRTVRTYKKGDVCLSKPIICKYFKSHDYIFADTKEEAYEELNRFYASCLGLDTEDNYYK